MKLFLSALILGYTILNAQILEVSQLFNKKLIKVQKEQIGTLKSFYGRTALNETKIYDIVTRFDGYITNLYANEQYKTIKKGNPLFTIYSDEVNSIQQEIQIAKKFNNSLVNSNIEKLKSLDINSALIKKIKSSNKTIKNISFYSPTNSIVLQKNINKGSFAKKGKLLLQLASLDELWFIASVYQKDLSFIKKDMKAKIYIDGIKEAIISKVDMIYPTVDLKTKAVDVRFVIPNKDLKLYANMFAKVDLKAIEKEMLTLPKTAVLSKGDKHFVFQYLSKTEFEPIEIKAKRISSNKYEVLEGLKEGQKVINNALFLLDSDAVTNGLYSSDDDDW
ncbi:MAG: cation transporter [Arcobacter sp.]|nr:MAG: cation transporter [Arcobacter sp.]